jgi:hypothetical protein
LQYYFNIFKKAVGWHLVPPKRLSTINQILIDHLPRFRLDVVHPPNLLHLIFRFKMFRHALAFRHLPHQPKKPLLCLLVNISIVFS